jgi:hypothetical protein
MVKSIKNELGGQKMWYNTCDFNTAPFDRARWLLEQPTGFLLIV